MSAIADTVFSGLLSTRACGRTDRGRLTGLGPPTSEWSALSERQTTAPTATEEKGTENVYSFPSFFSTSLHFFVYQNLSFLKHK